MPLDGTLYEDETLRVLRNAQERIRDPKNWCQGFLLNTFSVPGLIAWLENQDPAAEYKFMCTGCLIGQYLRSRGLSVKYLGTGTWTDGKQVRRELPQGFNDIAITEPHTYGAALARAKATLDV